MVRNKVAAVFLVLALAAVFWVPTNVRAVTGSTIVTVSPDPAQASVASSFDIIVRLENVKGMAAYQGTLTYNTSVLTATAADAEYSGGICEAGCEDISPETINDATGEVIWEVTLTGFATGFSGSGGMVKITFRVDAAGTSALTPLTFLLDTSFNDIVHTDFPGRFDTSPLPTADFQWDVNQDGTFENGTTTTGESVNFDGSISSNPLGGALTYSWDVFNDGTVDGTGASLTFTFTSPGGSIVKLTVCATGNVCSPKEKVIPVIAKAAPTALILPTSLTVNFTQQVDFNGSRSHDNNDPPQAIIRYIFTVNGTVAQNGTSAFFTYTAPSPGNYTVGLRTCNESNLCGGFSNAQLRVVNPTGKAPPTAILSPAGSLKVDFKTKTQFNATDSFDNNTPPQSIVRFIFRVNGTAAQDGISALFSFNSTGSGTYIVSLRVCNESNLCSLNPANATVAVNAIKAVPTAVLSPTSLKVVFGAFAVFSATQSRDNSNPIQAIVNYTFTVNGTRAQSGPSALFNFTAPTPGNYTIGLTVCNESRLCSSVASAQLTVNIVKADPTARITASAGKVFVGQTVNFDGSQSSDNSRPLQTIVRYIFSVGLTVEQDSTSAAFSFTPTASGTFTVSLKVCNESGLCSPSASVQVTVNDIHDLAINRVSASSTAVTRGTPVTLMVNVTNKGNVDETFTLRVTANGDPVTVTSRTLASGQTEVFSVSWSTASARGSYSILAEAILTSDIDQSNNQLSGGNIIVQVHDVSLVDAFVSQTKINPGDPVTIGVIAENHGDFAETITLTVTVEGQTALTSQSTTIQPGQQKTLNFTWTTTGVSPGTYGYEADLQDVPGDISTSDNVVLAPDAVEVVSPPSPAPPIDYGLLAIVVILFGLLAVVLLVRLRGRRAKSPTGP